MRKIDFALDVYPRATPDAPGGAREVPEAVHGDGERFVERRDQEGRGEMREMVLNTMHMSGKMLLREFFLQQILDGQSAATIGEAIKNQPRIRPMGRGKPGLSPEVGAGVAIDGRLFDGGEVNAGLGEAIADGLGGEAGPVLDAPEPLLLDRRDEDTVFYQACRRIAVIGVDAEDNHARFSVYMRIILRFRRKLPRIVFQYALDRRCQGGRRALDRAAAYFPGVFLPGHRLLHRACKIVRGIRHDHLACFGQRLRELHLMIVHMLAEGGAARHDDGDLPSLNSMHDGPGAGVHDQQVGLVDMLDKFIHAKKRHGPTSTVTEWRMPVLDNNRLGKPGRETSNRLQKAHERLQRVAQ